VLLSHSGRFEQSRIGLESRDRSFSTGFNERQGLKSLKTAFFLFAAVKCRWTRFNIVF